MKISFYIRLVYNYRNHKVRLKKYYPVEHVWDNLVRRVAGRQSPPQTLQVLERALPEEWDRKPQPLINSLIDSTPQRCSVLVVVRGNHTPY